MSDVSNSIEMKRLVAALVNKAKIAESMRGQESTYRTPASGAFPGFTGVNWGGIAQNGMGLRDQMKNSQEAIDADAKGQTSDWEAVQRILQSKQMESTPPASPTPTPIDTSGIDNLNKTTVNLSDPKEQMLAEAGMEKQRFAEEDQLNKVLDMKGIPPGPLEQRIQVARGQQNTGTSVTETSRTASTRGVPYSTEQLAILSQLAPKNELIKSLVDDTSAIRQKEYDNQWDLDHPELRNRGSEASTKYGYSTQYYRLPTDSKDKIRGAIYVDGKLVDDATGQPIPPDHIRIGSPNQESVNSGRTEANKTSQQKMAEAYAAVKTSVAVADRFIGSLDQLSNSSGIEAVASTKGIATPFTKYLSPEIAEFYADSKVADAGAWLAGFNIMLAGKGAGAMSNAEGEQLRQAFSNVQEMTATGDPAKIREAIARVSEVWRTYRKRAIENAKQANVDNNTAGEIQQLPDPATVPQEYTPEQLEILRKYK